MCMRCLRSPAIFKWPGDGIYIGLQVKLAVESRYPTFYACTGVSEGIAPVHPVTLRHGVAVGSLTADVVSPDDRCPVTGATGATLLPCNCHNITPVLPPVHHRFNRC